MKFELSISAAAHTRAVTGRVFVIVTRNNSSEPRLQLFDVPIFSADVSRLEPGVSVVIDESTPGYPMKTLAELPTGEYYLQGLLNVYTQFRRADGHMIWAHMDHWEGQDMGRSSGNLFSHVHQVQFDPRSENSCRLLLDTVIPPIEAPMDTEWVKHIKFQSKLLSEFWGHPIYLGATALLPRGYADHPEVRYPVVYVQGHFSLDAPLGFKTELDPPGTKSWARRREEWATQELNMPEPPPDAEFNGALYNVESGYEFYQRWSSDGFPRVIAVTLQHPTPYFDDSYGINSANAGPYGDALMTELIPRIEEEFRVIPQPYARVLTGCSTGGWMALGWQIYHPHFFGGVWAFCPDPVDFRRYYAGINLYEDKNAFALEGAEWVAPERPLFRRSDGQVRLTNRQFSRLALLTGTQDPGYGWTSLTPVSSDGYPTPVWDLVTGEIDRGAVRYMREHDCDLRDYLERNWQSIGQDLAGKLHLYCGDEDGGYFNLAVYLLEDFLKNTRNPNYGGSFTYGRPMKGHGWQPMTTAELVKLMAEHIRDHAPAGINRDSWWHDT